ncbi:MAG TPA: universal stress protein [Stellaceae bacterium]|nr:universal stress protein [Stellaceae bacterium]
MALRTILVAASGGSASDGAVETACRLAKRVGAHLEGFHVKVDPTQIAMLAADGLGMPVAGDWIDRLIEDADKLAETTKGKFAAAVERNGMSMKATPQAPAPASWHVEIGYAPVLVARRARFFDLAVLGRSERVVDRPHSDTIEETLVLSGRPVLLAPAKPPTAIGHRVALGWNGSAEAVHVMSAALPILEKADAVSAITVGDDAEADPLPLLEYLLAHGISAKHRRVLPVRGVGPGEQLLAEARDLDSDLLVMGAYGHRRWRELLFGGATREIVGTSLLPVLLAH